MALLLLLPPRAPPPRACATPPSPDARCPTSPAAPTQLARLLSPPGLSAHAWADLLLSAGASSVSLSDASAGTPHEVPLFAVHPPDGPPRAADAWGSEGGGGGAWEQSEVEAAFVAGVDVLRCLSRCAEEAGVELGEVRLERVGERDWVREVQGSWSPVVLPRCLTIRFPWHSDEEVAALREAPEATITLHPGMAFGTGEHATTQMCCAALLEAPLDGATLLDYGSGSGVLSLAALLFGASRAVAVEIDPEALAISEVNAAENGMSERFDALSPEAEAARGEAYPLVVANILAGTLIELQPLLCRRVAPGGRIILSGIWGEQQAAQVLEAYGEGFEFDPPKYTDGWALLQGTRSSAE
ncbi:hypothetical protein AB1Y20_011841 [Prymnesium parvum]|uniref:ETFB lysine methyltransferase n=1 Tax=Prymnesium parvum TaxID=97485 RepID=A0AB34IHI8_PRYPA